MTYSLTVADILSWYRSKQRSLEGSTVSLAEIREVAQEKAAAVAEFDGTDSTGRISGWISGEFDFEAIRGSDGKDLFWQHVDVSSTEQLEVLYVDFIAAMKDSHTLPE